MPDRGVTADARRWTVFVRTTSLNAAPSMIDHGIAQLTDTVMPAMSHLDGYLGMSFMIDRESGRGIVSTAWRNEELMRASADRVAPLRETAMRSFEASGPQIEAWEVAVMHRATHARAGSCVRATWLAMDSADVADAVDTFKHGTLARIEDLPGFCSASLFVNRAEGRAVTTVGYADTAAIQRSREGANALREQASREMTAQILDVAEFDLALAHLHVPEMI
jgi:hypothetical protein